MAQNSDEGTIGDRAYRRIRGDILQGRLAPGEKLKLDRLKEDYGVSVSTLREVLSRLSSEKLVVAEGQRGFEVAPVSVEELKDIASLRLLLEAGATIIVIDHDLDLLAAADYLIDMGPGGGPDGGRIVAQGTPRDVARDPGSVTAPWLAAQLGEPAAAGR